MENKLPLSDLEQAMALIVKNAIRQWNKSYQSYNRLWRDDEKASVTSLTEEAAFMEYTRIQLRVTLDIYGTLLGHEYPGKVPRSFLEGEDD